MGPQGFWCAYTLPPEMVIPVRVSGGRVRPQRHREGEKPAASIHLELHFQGAARNAVPIPGQYSLEGGYRQRTE